MADVLRQLAELVQTLPKDLLEITDSIYLYGSMARGDVTKDSDCDLLIAIKDCSEETFSSIKDATSKWHPELNCEIAIYQISALKAMQTKGSLFLWHIKTEAQIVYSRGNQVASILAQLAEYSGAPDAIAEYCEIMHDIMTDDTDDIDVIQYNLSIMATLIRNTCIVCCYLIGDKQFGRISPVRTCASYFKDQFPISLKDYEQLYLYRISINRGGNMPCKSNLGYYYDDWKTKTNALLALAHRLME